MPRCGPLVVAVYSWLTAVAVAIGTYCQVEICSPSGEQIAHDLDHEPGPADPPRTMVRLTAVASSTASTSSLTGPVIVQLART